MCRMRYRVLFFICLFFMEASKAMTSLPSQTDPCANAALASGTTFYCQFSHRDSVLNKFPTYRYLAAVEVYLRITTTPYITSITPSYFIDQLQERNKLFLIRNGSLANLEKAFSKYKEDLNKLKQLTLALGVPLEATKRDYRALTGEQICDWSLLRQKRKALWKSFRLFKQELSVAYETEVVLLGQYLHNRRLFEVLNSLANLDGSALPIYVCARPALFDSEPHLQHLSGLVVLSRQAGLFSSDTPSIRRDHPNFVGRPRALAVFVEIGSSGSILSHEYGHLYYLYHHWEAYTEYMEKMGHRYEIGGHGPGDGSGLAAELAEEGKMPDLSMPWAYRPSWNSGIEPISVAVEGEE
ncbi:MAG: hypothetical protein KTR30_30275 [Saprospiraceae bacterium]|nr:hypothetical protein [Saprospiraceae bacterium]